MHNWVPKAGLQPNSGKKPNHVALDETVIQLNDQRYRLYATADSEIGEFEFLHVRLFPTRNNGLTKQFVLELHEKHHVEDAVFLADGTPDS